MSVHATWRACTAAVALTVLTLLGACGGGGGGGENGGGITFSALSATVTTRYDVPEAGSPPDTGLSAQVSGDLAPLEGKTLFVRIDDPLGLFEPSTSISFDPATRRAGIVLVGRQQLQAGERSGRLGVRVCLDAGCQNALTPAGYGIDYTIRVRAGLRTTPSAVLVRVPFGTMPPTELVRVVVPQGRAPSEFDEGIVAESDGQVFDLARDLTPGTEGVRVAPRLLPVGRYERRLSIAATSADAGFGAQVYVQQVPLVLEVEPSAVDFAVLPAAVSFTIDHGTLSSQTFTVGAVAQTGSFQREPVLYDFGDEPPGTAYPLRGTWLQTFGDTWSVVVCAGSACLPRGLYRATLRFVRLSTAGFPTGQVVDVPVTLTVR